MRVRGEREREKESERGGGAELKRDEKEILGGEMQKDSSSDSLSFFHPEILAWEFSFSECNSNFKKCKGGIRENVGMKERWDSLISISREGDGQVPHENSSPSSKFLFSSFTGIDDIKRNVFPPSLHRRGPFFGVLGTIRLF